MKEKSLNVLIQMWLGSYHTTSLYQVSHSAGNNIYREKGHRLKSGLASWDNVGWVKESILQWFVLSKGCLY